MHLKNFDLNLLVALDALLAERNVTRASQRLFVTQPAMSNALQRIRDYFDDPLLVRRGREFELTPMASSLVSPVRELILDAGRLLAADFLFKPKETTRRFTLAMSDYCGTILLASIVGLCAEEAPGVCIDAVPLSERSINALSGGDLDMCLTAQDLRMLGEDPQREKLQSLLLFEDEFVCATSDKNSQVGDALDRETYLRLPHAITRFGTGTMSLEEQTLQRLNLDLHIVATAPTFACLALLVQDTPLIITVQRRLAERLAPAMRWRLFPPPVDIPRLYETLYWHPRKDTDDGHFWLRELLVRATAKALKAA